MEIKIDQDMLAAAIKETVVEGISPALRAAMSSSLKASMIAMVYGALSGRPSYMGDQEAQRWKAAELLLGTAPPCDEGEL